MFTLSSGRRSPTRGMTLLELIVVITIIGLLISMVAPKVVKWLGYGQQTAAQHDVQAIVHSSMMEYSATGKYPEEVENIDFDELPVDPWDRTYLYEVTPDGPRAWTYGRDGEPGGEGDDEDIFWPPEKD
jgi:general secretion pathway protein G